MAMQTFVARVKGSDPEMFAVVTADFQSLKVLHCLDFATETELRKIFQRMPDGEFAAFVAAARQNEVR